MIKSGGHTHSRGLERLGLPPESVDAIQRAADRMYYKHGKNKLFKTNYHTKLRDDHQNIVGYATFKRVGPPMRGRLLLSTILHGQQRPLYGEDISGFFDLNVKGKVPNTTSYYKGMDSVPNNTKKAELTDHEFLKARSDGAKKIKDMAAKKGGPSQLTAYHFAAKAQPYAYCLKHVKDPCFAARRADNCLEKLQDWSKMSPKEFQEVMGALEVYGEAHLKTT